LTSSEVSPKLKASIDKIDSFSGLLDSLYLAVRGFGSESSLYS